MEPSRCACPQPLSCTGAGEEGLLKKGGVIQRKTLFWCGKLSFRHFWNTVLVPTGSFPVLEALGQHNLPHVLKPLKS